MHHHEFAQAVMNERLKTFRAAAERANRTARAERKRKGQSR